MNVLTKKFTSMLKNIQYGKNIKLSFLTAYEFICAHNLWLNCIFLFSQFCAIFCRVSHYERSLVEFPTFLQNFSVPIKLGVPFVLPEKMFELAALAPWMNEAGGGSKSRKRRSCSGTNRRRLSARKVGAQPLPPPSRSALPPSPPLWKTWRHVRGCHWCIHTEKIRPTKVGQTREFDQQKLWTQEN